MDLLQLHVLFPNMLVNLAQEQYSTVQLKYYVGYKFCGLIKILITFFALCASLYSLMHAVPITKMCRSAAAPSTSKVLIATQQQFVDDLHC